MPMQHGEPVKANMPAPKLTEKGILNNNESLSRPDETSFTAHVRQAALSKLEEKLKGVHPDWPDDQVKFVATSMFEKASKKTTGKASGEGNADERPPEVQMKPAAPAGDKFKDTAETGVKSEPTAVPRPAL